ncbi:hypothetical protein [Dyadobacter frigoris]|uniref:DUF3300 domain-containing protein n=1 Tax=Dyadobacter frigoris TaxID=2576211 RepID=A0A4U6CZI5_9BACT|nr:hypothetical protein [Dyadobacter frigoris]TKT90290.1 hypothetical protein FDK13_21365 [Dyadobacter frigoris]GLU52525.1 hypothetical protein Dfri01_19860 [Dyadobacter frigoris]
MKSLRKGNSDIVTNGVNTFKPRLSITVFAAAILVTTSITGYSQNYQNNYGNQQYGNQQQYASPQQNGNQQQSYNNGQSAPAQQSLESMVAQYNDDVRNDILIATQYPDILTKLAQIRDNTTQAFQSTIQDYPQKKQNWFYEVSRYPDLMHQLATLPRRQSNEQIDGMVANVPNASADLKEAAWKLYNNHHSDLVTVDNLNQQAINSFEDMVSPLNRDAQNAFRSLQEMPDVLSILNDHSDLTTRLGREFRNDPDGTRQDLADLHDKQEAQNKQDLADYQKDLSQDPQAQQEYNQAQQQYASANNGYSYPAPTGDKVVNVYNNPYPYWFGYPSWYGSAMWYPGAYGFGGGLYYGMGLYGFPGFGFSSWFFGGAYRYYPHLYRTYGNFYRNNYLSRGRFSSPRSNGFIGAAGRHYSPNMGSARSNWLSSPNRGGGFSQGRTYSQGSRSIAPSQSNGNRSYGGNSFSRPSNGGGFSRGGGGFSGGGFRSGGGGGGMRGGGGGRR